MDRNNALSKNRKRFAWKCAKSMQIQIYPNDTLLSNVKKTGAISLFTFTHLHGFALRNSPIDWLSNIAKLGAWTRFKLFFMIIAWGNKSRCISSLCINISARWERRSWRFLVNISAWRSKRREKHCENCANRDDLKDNKRMTHKLSRNKL